MSNKKALIFSAPSGAGKTTVVNHLMETFPQTHFPYRHYIPKGEKKTKEYYYF